MADDYTTMYDWWPTDGDTRHVPEEKLTDEQLVTLARDGHMWLNAFSCINPKPEFLQQVGQMVVDNLNRTPLRTNGFGEPDAKGAIENVQQHSEWHDDLRSVALRASSAQSDARTATAMGIVGMVT